MNEAPREHYIILVLVMAVVTSNNEGESFFFTSGADKGRKGRLILVVYILDEATFPPHLIISSFFF